MLNDDEMVCWCSNVTAGIIRQAMRDGAGNMDDIRRMTGACTVGRCKELSPRGR
jgi:NAD(P)H-nitrite reductase large subunit